MNFDYKIGDTVKVIRTGQTYSTHVGAVKELGGDYDPADYEHFKRTNKLGNPVRRRWISNKNYKFKYAAGPKTGDIAMCLNISSVGFKANVFVLIERLSDSRQFVMGRHGVCFHDSPISLEDDLFEL